MSRHPYTHAADFIRHIIGPAKCSRATASHLIIEVAKACGIETETLANLLSNEFQKLWDIQETTTTIPEKEWVLFHAATLTEYNSWKNKVQGPRPGFVHKDYAEKIEDE